MASKEKSNNSSLKTLTQTQYEDDVYFMSVALMFAKKSPDPNTKVGACIVNKEGNIVGIGFNKMPSASEGDFTWERNDDDELKTKYPYVCHAVLNAIMNKTSADVKGCTVYTTLFPCNVCAKLIVQSGITEVVYLSNKYAKEVNTIASVKILDKASAPEKKICRQFLLMHEVSDLLDSIDPNPYQE